MGANSRANLQPLLANALKVRDDNEPLNLLSGGGSSRGSHCSDMMMSLTKEEVVGDAG